MTIPTRPTTERTAESGSPPEPEPWLLPLLKRLHFYAGLFIGPFILIAALSGAAYALTPQLEKILYAEQLNARSDGPPLPLAEQIAAAHRYAGTGTEAASLAAVRPAPEPGATTRVMYHDPGLGPSEHRAVFVDPGTGEVLGDLTVYGTSGALPLRNWIDQLHRGLHLGDAGRLYSELAASWLWVIALSGLGLWAAAWIRGHRRGLLRPNRRAPGRWRTVSLHASLGFWLVLGALALSATGITWSQYGGANVSLLREQLGWQTPALSTSLTEEDGAAGETSGDHAHHTHQAGPAPTTQPGEGPNPATFDAVLSAGRDVNIDTGEVEIRPPAEAGSAWVVQEIQRSWPTQVDSVAIDGRTLDVTDRTDFAEFPLAAKLSRWGIDLHMGSMFGLANQLVLLVLGLGIATLVVLGYRMWWQRRPGFTLTDPARVLGRVPWAARIVLALLAVGIGVLLPLWGWSLLAFLAFDALVAVLGRRRAGRRPAA
ncbi:PepSY-associated TM helix domain-containing protein [Sediminivirga luteola]|uniref:Membrane protein n=1 Tax=Sediminivirga luteola TaxID=1774748 RepID=A0A8J2TVP3_9MICO|nr:PepSY-associated TM helix domain-containing protein [Sediminivirga luteola]GGA04943.1 membrane protein [Sediminivirga luteola]